MAKQRKNEQSVTLEISLTIAALLVLFGWSMRSTPIMFAPPEEELKSGDPPEAGLGADVLVVLPTAARATTLDQLITDQAWLNAVEQEVGEVRTIHASQLSRSVMDPVAWMIIPKLAASQLDPTQTQFVRNWIEDGGVVILEQPTGPWQGITGINSMGGNLPNATRITSFDGAITHGESRADVAQTPLHTTLMPFNPSEFSQGVDYQILMEVENQPGIIERELGRGRVFVLLFDFGMAVTVGQQGLPDSSFNIHVAAESSLPDEITHTTHLVADQRLRTSRIPYFDLLERNILYLADSHRPVARLWLYPRALRGALIVTHSEGGYGKASQFMPGWEHDNDVSSTLFVVPGSMSPEALARVGRVDGDLALEWLLPSHPQAPRRTWGVRRFRPFQRPMTLSEQFHSFNEDSHPYGPTVVSRSFNGLWSTSYFSVFRRLEAIGIQLDSSYAPAPSWMTNNEEEYGYLWGTGLPFHPLDKYGNRFSIFELPVSIDDRSSGYTLEMVRRMLIDASDRYHTTVVGNWHPDTMGNHPSFDALEGWRQSFDWAESQDLWVTTMSEYARFLSARKDATIDSSFSREERRLSINVRFDSDPAIVPAIAFLARFEGRPIERIVVDGSNIEIAELPLTGDRVLNLLPMTVGQHHIEVFYATPSEH